MIAITKLAPLLAFARSLCFALNQHKCCPAVLFHFRSFFIFIVFVGISFSVREESIRFRRSTIRRGSICIYANANSHRKSHIRFVNVGMIVLARAQKKNSKENRRDKKKKKMEELKESESCVTSFSLYLKGPRGCCVTLIVQMLICSLKRMS